MQKTKLLSYFLIASVVVGMFPQVSFAEINDADYAVRLTGAGLKYGTSNQYLVTTKKPSTAAVELERFLDDISKSSDFYYDPPKHAEPLTTTSLTGYYGFHERYGNTVTKLNNGKILVAGGTNGAQALSSAFVYDPLTETNENLTNMLYERVWHTATLLPDGNVIMIGGKTHSPLSNGGASGGVAGLSNFISNFSRLFDANQAEGGEPLNTAEVYMSQDGEFISLRDYLISISADDYVFEERSPSGDMLKYRANHTATYLPETNQILIMGGALPDPSTSILRNGESNGLTPVSDNVSFQFTSTSGYVGPGTVVGLNLEFTDNQGFIDPFATAEVNIQIHGDARFVLTNEDLGRDIKSADFTLRPQSRNNANTQVEVNLHGYNRINKDLGIVVEAIVDYQGSKYSKLLKLSRRDRSFNPDRNSSPVVPPSEVEDDSFTENPYSIFRQVEDEAAVAGEILDLNTGEFLPIPDSLPNSFDHSAIGLDNGTVLLAGGDFSSFIVYDPVEETFTAVREMQILKKNMSPLLIKNADGLIDKIIFVGGIYKTYNDLIASKYGIFRAANVWADINPWNRANDLQREGLAPWDVYVVDSGGQYDLQKPKNIKASEDKGGVLNGIWARVKDSFNRARIGLPEDDSIVTAANLIDHKFLLVSTKRSAIYDYDTNTISNTLINHEVPYYSLPEKESGVIVDKDFFTAPAYANAIKLDDDKVLIAGGRLKAPAYPIYSSFSGPNLGSQGSEDRYNASVKFLQNIPKFEDGNLLRSAFSANGIAAMMGLGLIAKNIATIERGNIDFNAVYSTAFPTGCRFGCAKASNTAWLFETDQYKNLDTGIRDNNVSEDDVVGILPPPAEVLRRSTIVKRQNADRLSGHKIEISYPEGKANPYRDSVLNAQVKITDEKGELVLQDGLITIKPLLSNVPIVDGDSKIPESYGIINVGEMIKDSTVADYPPSGVSNGQYLKIENGVGEFSYVNKLHAYDELGFEAYMSSKRIGQTDGFEITPSLTGTGAVTTSSVEFGDYNDFEAPTVRSKNLRPAQYDYTITTSPLIHTLKKGDKFTLTVTPTGNLNGDIYNSVKIDIDSAYPVYNDNVRGVVETYAAKFNNDSAAKIKGGFIAPPGDFTTIGFVIGKDPVSVEMEYTGEPTLAPYMSFRLTGLDHSSIPKEYWFNPSGQRYPGQVPTIVNFDKRVSFEVRK
ncbi:MAG: kelch repeat-containing protein [Patescibacteria group bacterium]